MEPHVLAAGYSTTGWVVGYTIGIIERRRGFANGATPRWQAQIGGKGIDCRSKEDRCGGPRQRYS